MARVIFENLTKEQAEILASWYSGQGEQDADIWFEANDTKTPTVGTIGKGYDDDVIVYCK